MIRMKSQALGTIKRALGLSGPESQTTEFHDGILEQTFDVTSSVRRGNTLGVTEGIFTGALQNVHGAAETLIAQADVYALPGVTAIAPWPSPVPPGFDVWLLGAFVRQTLGAGTLDSLLLLQYGVQGFGIDDSDVAVTFNSEIPIARWDAVFTEGNIFGLQNGGGGPFVHVGMRIPRANTPVLSFRSTSSELATFTCQCIMGLFPAGLGQDALVV